MAEILTKILQAKKAHISRSKKQIPLSDLENEIKSLEKCRNFYQALTKDNKRGINVITEIKRASPSAGLIRADFDPVQLARIYHQAGADAISVN